MDISPSFDLLWRIANAEAWHCHSEVIEPIHFWIACLKLVDPSVVDAVRLQFVNLRTELQSERNQILSYLEMDADSARTRRRKERALLLRGKPPRNFPDKHCPCLHRSESSRRLFDLTGRKARERGLDTVTPRLLLECLFEMNLISLDLKNGFE